VVTRRRLLAATLAGGAVTLGLTACTRRDAVPPATFDPDRREFGVAADPWHMDEWAQAVGAKPTMAMEFEAFSRRRTIDTHFAEARRQGLHSFMVTWEPWVSVSAALGKAAQHKEQPEYSNAAVAAGGWDEYLRGFARSVAAAGLIVYIRYAHEMNGDWYPWSRDPKDYVAAWQRLVNVFREEGASNAKFVYSMNPSVWVPPAEFEQPVRDYWPGDQYVDFLGSTVINFGGKKSYAVSEFATRLELMRSYFSKDMIITELNTAADGRVKWMTDLRTWLAGATWVRGVVLSQGASRGQAQLGDKVGDLSWDVLTDKDTQPVIKAIIDDFVRS
jgi:mannan endo-1,4-beta-mannosidase